MRFQGPNGYLNKRLLPKFRKLSTNLGSEAQATFFSARDSFTAHDSDDGVFTFLEIQLKWPKISRFYELVKTLAQKVKKPTSSITDRTRAILSSFVVSFPILNMA